MKFTYFKSGEYSVICDVCGFKFKSKDLKQRWDGLMVCSYDWEMRHPQELIRPIQDQNKLPWTRPEGTDQFITVSTLGSVAVTAASNSVTITDARITASSKIMITGMVPEDPYLNIARVTPGSGSAVVAFSRAPYAATTLYYFLKA